VDDIVVQVSSWDSVTELLNDSTINVLFIEENDEYDDDVVIFITYRPVA